MMTSTHWAIYLILLTTMVYSPGPMTLFIMANGINVGYRKTIFAILGGSTAYLIQMFIVACGVGLLLQNSPIAFSCIKYSGAMYLFYLGIKQLRSNGQIVSITTQGINKSFWGMYNKGFLMGISNPKALLVFTVLFPQFINVHFNQTIQFVILGITFLIMQFISATTYALVGAKVYLTLQANRKEKYQNLLFGMILIIIGLALLAM